MESSDSPPHNVISAICAAFASDGLADTHYVAKSEVLAWMQVSDLEVQGALYSKIADGRAVTRVQPQLTFDDCFPFVLSYLEQCMIQNPKSAWADSRYSAGRQLVDWVRQLWHERAVYLPALTKIKHHLAALYVDGDNDMRDAVVNAVLEHLFETEDLRGFFEDWKEDRILGTAYRDALAWITQAPPQLVERLGITGQVKPKKD